MVEIVETIVDGGAANPGPMAPTLGPLGVNMGEIVKQINEKTAEYKGMKVPVKITVADNKSFTIKVGTPPASALVKEKAGVKSASGNARTTFVADLSLEDVISIVKMKGDDLMGADVKQKAREIVGTCTSMGITIEGLDGREMQKQLAAGKFDDRF